MTEPRICSLLPSATEIVCALGLDERLVAVTHECDYPPEIRSRPAVTSSVIDPSGLSAREIDQAVRNSLAETLTIYHLDRDLLAELRPDLVLTQELCEVCAVGTPVVRDVVASLPHTPRVVSLEPRSLGDVFDTILQVGRLTNRLRRAVTVTQELRARLAAVQAAVATAQPRRVLTLEWVDPIFVGGHWVPEMVEMAGGQDVLGRAGNPSREVSWDEVAASRPEVIVAMPCGFGLERSAQELAASALPGAWRELPAVKADQVYVVDGSSYFNRPGPRLIDGVEILASILHPDRFSKAPTASFTRFSPAPAWAS